MRLAFMGTPEFAVPSLSALMQSGGHEILLVVTQPDKPQGRGMHLQSPPVKATAVQSGLEVLQPASLKGAAALKDMLISSRLDAVIVVAYGKMIPEDWLPITRLGFINIHASLLPELRGAAPINRAIIEGKSTTGISIMRIEAAMDAGPVFRQTSTPIGDEEDAVGLSRRLSVLGAEKIIEVLPLIEKGSLQPRPQDHARATYAPMLRKEEGEIDWNQDARTICNRVRGLVPWPCAYTYLHGRMLKILRASSEQAHHGYAPGTMIKERRGIRIACRDGFIVPLDLQMEGKKAACCEAFSCGLRTDRDILGR